MICVIKHDFNCVSSYFSKREMDFSESWPNSFRTNNYGLCSSIERSVLCLNQYTSILQNYFCFTKLVPALFLCIFILYVTAILYQICHNSIKTSCNINEIMFLFSFGTCRTSFIAKLFHHNGKFWTNKIRENDIIFPVIELGYSKFRLWITICDVKSKILIHALA